MPLKILFPKSALIVGLQQFHLDANGMTELPQSLSKLTNLSVLSLANNKISKLLPDCLPSTLEVLDLGSNLLEDIDIGKHTLEGLASRLSHLELRENHITQLPDSFTCLNALTKVHFFALFVYPRLIVAL